MGLSRKVITLLVVVLIFAGALIGVAVYTGVVAKPTAGVTDLGDWGQVTEDRTEVITTLWVQNPNPLGVKIGNSVTASFNLTLNGIFLATGEKSGIKIQPGNNTVQISTYILNEQLPPWWVAFVQNNETIPLRAEATAHIDAGPLSTAIDLPPQEKTLLDNATPVINALSQAAASAEGNYTETVGTAPAEETVGYVILRGWATWGDIDEEQTRVLFHFRIHNPSDTVAIPAVPDGIGMSVDMNGIRMFRAQSEEMSPQNVDGDSVIPPGETQEVVLQVEMDNTKIDDWFRSHVKKGEQTEIETQFQMVFSVNRLAFRIPEESDSTYSCQLQTAILVDDQTTSTDCLQPESAPGVETTPDTSDTGLTDTATPTPITPTTPTATITPTSSPGGSSPNAQLTANKTEGEAPLTVLFDAGDSSDPENDIERYVWEFGDGSLPKEGKTVTHTYQIAGEYTVILTVTDSEGNQDTATTTITVQPGGS